MRNKIIKKVSTKLKPKKKKFISKAVIPLLTVWLKVKFKVEKSFKKKIYIYIYIYQRGKGTLYIKLSMLQENSLSNQTWDVCLLDLISSMKVGLWLNGVIYFLSILNQAFHTSRKYQQPLQLEQQSQLFKANHQHPFKMTRMCKPLLN